MQFIALRLMTDWFKGSTGGLDVKLAAMVPETVRDKDGDFIPTSVGFIGNDSEDECVAQFYEPPSYPAIYITEDGSMGMQGEVTTNFRDTLLGEGLPVAVRIIQQEFDTVAAIQARGYLLRAIMQSLEDWLSNANEASRIRSGVQVMWADHLRMGPWEEEVGEEAKVTSALVVTLQLRDCEV